MSRHRRGRFGHPSRERALNSYIDVIDQSLSIVMRRTTEEEGRYADLVIAPQVRSFSFLDSSQADAIIGRGREAALAHIEAIGRLSDAGPGIPIMPYANIKSLRRGAGQKASLISGMTR